MTKPKKSERFIVPAAPVTVPEPSPSLAEEEGERIFPEATPLNRIRVQRQDDFSRKVVLHGYMGYDEQTEARVAELWGGGKYIVCMVETNEQGYSMIKRRKEITILGAYKPPAGLYGLSVPVTGTGREGGERGAVVAGAPVALSPSLDLSRMSPREAIEAAQVSQLLEITKMGREVRAGTDWAKLLPLFLPVVESVLTRVLAPRGENEIVAAVRALEAKLGNQPGPAQSQLGDILKAIDQVMGVREGLRAAAAEEPKETDSMQLVAKILDMVTTAQRRDGPEPPPASRVSGKVEVPVPVTGPAPQLWQQMLRHYAPQLLGAARSGKDPEFMAEVAVQFMPADMTGVAIEFVQRPDAAAVACQEIPALAEFPAWNAAFWEACRVALLGGEEEVEKI